RRVVELDWPVLARRAGRGARAVVGGGQPLAERFPGASGCAGAGSAGDRGCRLAVVRTVQTSRLPKACRPGRAAVRPRSWTLTGIGMLPHGLRSHLQKGRLAQS